MPAQTVLPEPARIQLLVADTRAAATLARAAARAGMEVIAGGTGAPPDVVVAEWPPQTGISGLLDLRHRPELLAVVPAGDPAAAESALDAGAGDCLMMPLRAAETSMRLTTALRRARERASLVDPAALVDALPTGLAVLAADGRICQVNRTLERIAGTPSANLVGMRLGRDRLLGPDTATVTEVFRRARATGSADAELTLLVPGAPARPVTVRVAASRDDTGTVSGYVLTVRPPTERERAQAAVGRVTSACASESAAEVFARLAREAGGLVGARGVVIMRSEPDGQRVVGAWGDTVAAGTVIEADARVARAHALRRGDAEAEVAVPLRVGGRDWGQMAVVTPVDHRRAATETLARFGGVAALAAADADARDGRGDPSRDPLTGLPGYGAFFTGLATLVAEARAARRPVTLVLVDIDHLKRLNDTLGHVQGDVAVREIGRRIAAAADPGHMVARVGGEEFAWVLDGADAAAGAEAARRLRRAIAETPIPSVGNVTASFGVAQLGGGEPGADAPNDLHRQAEVALEFAKINGRNQYAVYSFEVAEQVHAHRADQPAETPSLRAMRALAWAVDARDPNTHRHSERVANLAVQIATALGWPHERCIQLREAGIVHDVGKIAVPDRILLKSGRLTDEERRIMNLHPEEGAEIVADVLSADQASWVRAHHERWDGGGYPDGLAGDEIPEEARVLALADSFDVMRSARSYKEARDLAWALGEAKACAGTQFWPPAVEALERCVEAGVITDEPGVAVPGMPAAVSAAG